MSGMVLTLRRAVVAVLAVLGASFLLVAHTPLANALALPLCSVRSQPTRAEVILVLSGGSYLDGSLNEAALERTIAAVRLYRQGLAPRILFSGGPCCGQSASWLMADLAKALGVPPSVILLEEQSLRTHESAIRSRAILRANGMRTALLVTSQLHLLRAKLAFEAEGLSAHPVRASEKNLWLVSGAAERLTLLADSLHEYAGLAFYRARGWI